MEPQAWYTLNLQDLTNSVHAFGGVLGAGEASNFAIDTLQGVVKTRCVHLGRDKSQQTSCKLSRGKREGPGCRFGAVSVLSVYPPASRVQRPTTNVSEGGYGNVARSSKPNPEPQA